MADTRKRADAAHAGGQPAKAARRTDRVRKVYISRTESFSSAHRLHSPHLSDEDNRKIFGKCNHAHGHGHNYRITVTVFGAVDKATGMVMNLTDLKQHIKTEVIDPMDHRNLDMDVPYFRDGVVSTAENIAVFAWDALAAVLAPGLLYEIRIDETDKNSVFYRGE